jgi:putative flippase GtrA
MKCVSREFAAFIAVGLANTIFTYLFYLLLLMFVPYAVSYTLAYLAGIGLSYGLNSVFVFREPLSWRKGLRFPAVYAVLYVFSVTMLWVLVEGFLIHPYVAPLLVLAASVPLSFLLSRFVIRGRSRSTGVA